jgi:hypothetical protein
VPDVREGVLDGDAFAQLRAPVGGLLALVVTQDPQSTQRAVLDAAQTSCRLRRR